jgi:hypothetical protein
MKILSMQKHPEHGYYQATVLHGGYEMVFDLKYGSWQLVEGVERLQPFTWVAEALQTELHKVDPEFVNSQGPACSSRGRRAA